MYVIRNSNGRYVANPGMRSSFTPFLENARKFSTREAAQRECCGNETVLSISEILG
jgi:hypothetical protein